MAYTEHRQIIEGTGDYMLLEQLPARVKEHIANSAR